jgi:hypothetical protein
MRIRVYRGYSNGLLDLLEHLDRLIRERVVGPIRFALKCQAGGRELLALNDRMLADIGLYRCPVRGVAYRPLDEERIRAPQRGSWTDGERTSGTAMYRASIGAAFLVVLLAKLA